jgi:hypothetical protein
VVVTVAPIAITITMLESLVTRPRLLPRIRLLRCKGTLPAKFLIPLPSIVVTRSDIAIGWRTELNAYGKLLCLRLRRSRQCNRPCYQTNRYALHYHRLYAREFHNNLLLTSD